MPKFPDDNNILSAGLFSFPTATQMQEFDFTFEAFEQEADDLDKQYPGEGYQRAYDKTVLRLFDTYASMCIRRENPDISVDDVVYYFDSFLMNPYIAGAKRYGIDVNIKTNGKKLNLNTLVAFDEALEKLPKSTPLDETYKKFKRNELTLDTVAADVKARKNTVPSKDEALELISRAAFLEERMSNRSFLNKLGNLFTYIREILTVNALKDLASKVDDPERLVQEAEIGSVNLAILRARIDTLLLHEQSKESTAKLEEKAARLATAHNDLENGLDFDQLDKNESSLNGATDLGEIDDAFTTEDEEIAQLGDADISFHFEDSPIEIGESGEVIATDAARLANDSDVAGEDSLPDFGNESVILEESPEKISIVIDELSNEEQTVQKSERINEKEVSSKGSISID